MTLSTAFEQALYVFCTLATPSPTGAEGSARSVRSRYVVAERLNAKNLVLFAVARRGIFIKANGVCLLVQYNSWDEILSTMSVFLYFPQFLDLWAARYSWFIFSQFGYTFKAQHGVYIWVTRIKGWLEPWLHRRGCRAVWFVEVRPRIRIVHLSKCVQRWTTRGLCSSWPIFIAVSWTWWFLTLTK